MYRTLYDTFGDVHCTLYNVHLQIHVSVHYNCVLCILYSVYYSVYLYITQCIMYQCTLYMLEKSDQKISLVRKTS